ncbi:hypothetical protein BLOT_011125 [Blomia tropicalis]|nr:hypothetical protein BLOT_011125 [Blomia tropicalis]
MLTLFLITVHPCSPKYKSVIQIRAQYILRPNLVNKNQKKKKAKSNIHIISKQQPGKWNFQFTLYTSRRDAMVENILRVHASFLVVLHDLFHLAKIAMP